MADDYVYEDEQPPDPSEALYEAAPYDLQEYSGMRRVKPLPKRRRMSDDGRGRVTSTLVTPVSEYSSKLEGDDDVFSSVQDHLQQAPRPSSLQYLALAAGMNISERSSSPYAPLPSTDPPSLSLTMPESPHLYPASGQRSVATVGNLSVSGGSEEDDDVDQLDGEYGDHLQQPNNTKKRKTPATYVSRGLTSGADQDTSEPLNYDGDHQVQGFSGGQLGNGGFITDAELVKAVPVWPNSQTRGTSSIDPSLSLVSSMDQRPQKTQRSSVTLAALRYKELLRSRKRQIISVLNGSPNPDALALDQALSSPLPWFRSSATRLHSRQRFRLKQSLRPLLSLSSSHTRINYPRHTSLKPIQRSLHPTSSASPTARQTGSFPLPRHNSPFSFECQSPASERYRTIQAEAAALANLFQRELERQAAVAAEKARQAALTANQDPVLTKSSTTHPSRPNGTWKPRKTSKMPPSDSVRGRDGSHHENPSSQNSYASALGHTQSSLNAGNNHKRSKKKKRSALANASNPHHLRNYVPSRLPNSAGGGIGGVGGSSAWGTAPLLSVTLAQAAQAFLGPPPIRFLTADRRSGYHPNRGSSASLTIPQPAPGMAIVPDEWMCAFCEYDLFFGSEWSFRKAVKSRKRILKRRRRARERAARAAAGGAKGTASGSSPLDAAVSSGALDDTVADDDDAETEDEDEDKEVIAEEDEANESEGLYESAQMSGPQSGADGRTTNQVAVGGDEVG